MLHRSTLDVVTLFYSKLKPASEIIAKALKESSVSAQTRAAGRGPFELDITNENPTTDQLRTILTYVGKPQWSTVIKGHPKTEADALRSYTANVDIFKRPVVVDWNNGRAIATEEPSQVLKMLGRLNEGDSLEKDKAPDA